MDLLLTNCYYVEIRSLIFELESHLHHEGPICKNNNAEVCIKIEAFSRGTSVESTIKSLSRHKDGHGSFKAMIDAPAGEVKHRSISKK